MMRTNSYSSLDFTYWVLDGVVENYTVTDGAIYAPSSNDSIMRDAVVEAASICGLTVPRTISALLMQSSKQKTLISPEKAMQTRGSVLVKDGCLYVSLGDRHRLVGADSADSISLFNMTVEDLDPSSWGSALLLPGMRYL